MNFISCYGSALIPLWNCERVVVGWALVDEQDAPRVTAYRWIFHGDGYAMASRVGSMARWILGLPRRGGPDGLQADHINRNRLDNRRKNLRAVTRAENLRNRGAVNERGSRTRSPRIPRFSGVVE